MSKESFKEFVKKNPGLTKHVYSNGMSWQKFYEMYDMYGEDNDIWNEYLQSKVEKPLETRNQELSNYFKNINLDTVQESINSLQRVLGVLGEIVIKKDNAVSSYEPKPIYKHLDD